MPSMVDWIFVGNNYWPVHFLLWWYFPYCTVLLHTTLGYYLTQGITY